MNIRERYEHILRQPVSVEEQAVLLLEMMRSLSASEGAELQSLLDERKQSIEAEAFVNYQSMSPQERAEIDRILGDE